MAARRKRVRHNIGKKQYVLLGGVLFLCVAVGGGLALRSYRQQEESPAVVPAGDDSLRREVEARRVAAEERARRQAEEARLQDAAVVVESLPQDEKADPPVADTAGDPPPLPPIEEPTAEEPPTPAAPQTPQPGVETGEPEQPEETGEPTPAEPDEAPEPQPEPIAPEPAKPAENEEVPNPYTEHFSLTGSSSLSQQKQWNDLVEKMLNRGEVGLVVDGLGKKINEALPELFSGDRFKVTLYRSSVNFVNAVELCYITKVIGEKKMRDLLKQRDGKAFLQWALTDKSRPLHRLLQAFKFNAGEAENLAYALKTFYKIWVQTPNGRERVRYLNLAIACALVHPAIAESRGKMLMRDEVLLGMPDVFEYYRKGDSGRSLRGGFLLTRLGVSALLHVVDARLPLSEYEWVNKNITLPRDKWKQLYDTIEYRMNFATQNSKNPYAPYSSYTFAEIKKTGGVCREQAYYTATTAKCAGIPAVIITGDGNRGGHAWVGLMVSEKAWVQVGSYNYNTGYFINPCSNKPQHESTLLNQDKNLTEERLEPATDTMLLANYLMLCQKQDAAMNTARYVCSAFPKYTTGWRNRIDIMEEMHAFQPLEENVWKQLRNELERNVGKNSELVDMAQEVDVKHLMNNMRDVVKMTALKRAYKRLTNPMTGRVDLLLDCIRRQAKIYVDAGNKRDMASFYRQMFKAHKDRGDIYALLVAQCATLLTPEDKFIFKTLARDAEVNYAKQAFNNTDFFKASKDAEVMRAIAKLYRGAEDDARAISLESAAEAKLEEIAKIAERSEK